MRAALFDLLSGIVIVVVTFLDVRLFMESRALVYLVFPVLCAAALLVGFWRCRERWYAAILVSLPLFIVCARYFSGRTRPLIILPIVVLIFAAIGGRLTQTRARIGAAAISFATAFAGPMFVALLMHTPPGRGPDEFTIHMIDGRTISSHELRGRVVVLDFWASWCGPCRRELPLLQRTFAKFRDQRDIAFFAIDGSKNDADDETPQLATDFFRRGNYTMPLAWDSHRLLGNAFGVTGYPTLLVLDRNGRVQVRHAGFAAAQDLEATLTEQINALR